MRYFLPTALALLLAAPASAQITLEQAQAEAHQWVVARQDAILDRILACIDEGSPGVCHTAWAASVTPNTLPADPGLATVTLDDPGRFDTSCGGCFTGEGTYAQAGVSIPATAPVNAKLDVEQAPNGWGARVIIRIQYDGTLYERGYGRGTASGFAWREVVEAP